MPDYPVWEQTDTGVNIKFTRILPIKIAEYEFFKKRESVPVVPEMGFSCKLHGEIFGAHEKACIFAARLKTTAMLIKPNVFNEKKTFKQHKIE